MGSCQSDTKKLELKDPKPVRKPLGNDHVQVNMLKNPLTKMQIYTITKTWKAVSKNLSFVGARVFVRLFSRSEYLKAYFSHLTDNQANSLDRKEAAALEVHGEAVMKVVDYVVQNLDNIDNTASKFEEVGRLHTRLSDFNRFIFWFIEEPFLHVMKVTIGREFNTDAQEAYRWLICFVITRLSTEFQIARADIQSQRSL